MESSEADSERPADEPALERLPAPFAQALSARGYHELTEIQRAVLDPECAERDLRISSQTGSGKTLALGFVVADTLLASAQGPDAPKRLPSTRGAQPRALVVAPTRELAAQLGQELSWLYGPTPVRMAVVTGGTSIHGDLRALATGPNLVIGTPGRLVDHLKRGVLDLSSVHEIVLDEADEMLDMGFREELEALLDETPGERRTHLVSATFPPKVRQLAEGYQRNAHLVEGRVGTQHQDIQHSALVVEPQQRLDALVNLLLRYPDERFLVFVRTRVTAAAVAGELSGLGLSVSPLSGEMAQRERTRCLNEFRARRLQCVVATDVAARGLDIPGVQRVIHYDLPENREAFTHRSGRTGRAGEKGESILLTGPRARGRVQNMFRIMKVDGSFRTAPTPAKIRKAARRRWLRQLTRAQDPPADGSPETSATNRRAPEPTPPPSGELLELAEQLLERREAPGLVAELLDRIGVYGPTEPREIRSAPQPKSGPPQRSDRDGPRPARARASQEPGAQSGFVRFHVTWGAQNGANPKRLLAHVCRRGGITGQHVGAIRVHEFRATVDIAESVARDFERAVGPPDPRNPRIRIERWVPYEERTTRGAKPRSGDRDRRGPGRPPKGRPFRGKGPPGRGPKGGRGRG